MPKKRFKDFQQLVKLSFMYWQLAGIFTVTFVIIIISDFCVSCLEIHVPCIYIQLCIDTYCLVDIEKDCRHAESLGAQMLRLSHRPRWRGWNHITMAKVNSCKCDKKKLFLRGSLTNDSYLLRGGAILKLSCNEATLLAEWVVRSVAHQVVHSKKLKKYLLQNTTWKCWHRWW